VFGVSGGEGRGRSAGLFAVVRFCPGSCAAIQETDPGVLIIAEGRQNYSSLPAGSGMKPEARAREGNLTGVATDHIELRVPHELIYEMQAL